MLRCLAKTVRDSCIFLRPCAPCCIFGWCFSLSFRSTRIIFQLNKIFSSIRNDRLVRVYSALKTEKSDTFLSDWKELEMEDIFKIPEQETKSKFQEHGQLIYQSLLKLRADGDTRVRPHQTEAALETQKLINDFNILRQPAPVLVVAPTGSGKTGIMVLLSYVLQCKKVLVVTPSADISNQIAVVFGAEKTKPCFFQRSGVIREEKTLNGLLEPVKVIRNPTPITKMERLPNLVIVNAQKFGGTSSTSLMYGNTEIIANVKEFFEQFDTLFVDEAHHYPAPTWTRIVEEFGVGLEKKVVFLTATPYAAGREKVKILPSQQVAYHVLREDIEGKCVRPCDFEEIEEDYSDDRLFDDINSVLDKHRKQESRIDKHQALVLVLKRDDCDELVEMLNASLNDDNYAVAIYAGKKKEEKLKDFNGGKYTVAVVCGCLLEGYDNPNVSLCVIVRNVVSPLLFSQFTGRCLQMAGLPGEVDRTRACVLTYKKFKQRRLWTERDTLATTDPVMEGEGGRASNESNGSTPEAKGRRKMDAGKGEAKKRRKLDFKSEQFTTRRRITKIINSESSDDLQSSSGSQSDQLSDTGSSDLSEVSSSQSSEMVGIKSDSASTTSTDVTDDN